MGRRTALPQEDLEELYANSNDPKVRLKILTLLQLREGKTIKETTEIFKVHRDTVRNWIKQSSNGLSGLATKPMSGRKTKLRKEDEETFKKVFKEESDKRVGGRLTGQDIQQILAKEFNAVYTLTGVYRLLKRLKIVWITSRSIHPKQDPLVQEDFKKNFKENVEKVLPKDIPLDKVEIWFQDEARVGQQGTTTRVWAEKGTRPRVVKQQQFLYGYIFGAVCPKTGKTAALVLPELNSKTMQLHLDLISSEIEESKHAIMICDQASWHVTQKLKWPKNLSCLSLPPYSPELNPMEQVWQYLRQHYLSNRCFDGYNAILDACCNAWNGFTKDVSKVIRLCTRKWASAE